MFFWPTGSRDGRSSECIVDISWEKHPRVGPCKVCSVILKRGRPAKIKKTKGKNLTTSTTNDDSTGLPIKNNGSLFEIPPPLGTSYGPVTPLVVIIGKSTDEQTIFVCCVCQCILSSSVVQTPCEHNFCSTCLSSWFKLKKASQVPCPVCRQMVHLNQVSQCPRVLRLQLFSLLVACVKCGTVGILKRWQTISVQLNPPNILNVAAHHADQSSLTQSSHRPVLPQSFSKIWQHITRKARQFHPT